jgi:hypothetical protein
MKDDSFSLAMFCYVYPQNWRLSKRPDFREILPILFRHVSFLKTECCWGHIGYGVAGPGNTFGSSWPTLPILGCLEVAKKILELKDSSNAFWLNMKNSNFKSQVIWVIEKPHEFPLIHKGVGFFSKKFHLSIFYGDSLRKLISPVWMTVEKNRLVL